MQVDNAKNAFVAILDIDPVFNRAEIIADMNFARGLYA
jgi:hypothetical protein